VSQCKDTGCNSTPALQRCASTTPFPVLRIPPLPPPQVLFSYIWELTVLHEDVDLMSAAGGGLVMAGVIAVALGGTPKEEAQTLAAESGQQQQEQLVASDTAGVQYVLVRSSLDIEAAPAGAAGHPAPHLLWAAGTPSMPAGTRVYSKMDAQQEAGALMSGTEGGRQVHRRSNAGPLQEADHAAWSGSAPQAIAVRQCGATQQQGTLSDRHVSEGGLSDDASAGASGSSTDSSRASSPGSGAPDMRVVCRPVPALTYGQAAPTKQALDHAECDTDQSL
jgi:hypothetical protein